MEATAAPIIKAGVENGSYRGWLMEREGEVVAGGGLVIVGHPSAPHNPSPTRAWILSMYTEPQYRRQGFVKAISRPLLPGVAHKDTHGCRSTPVMPDDQSMRAWGPNPPTRCVCRSNSSWR
jgi:hypothetical protein